MIFLDTGFFIGLFTADDELHVRALAWSDILNDEELIVSEYVLWECINHFSKRANRSSAHAIVEYVNDGCEIVRATPELFDAGLKMHSRRMDKEWSLTDCVSFYIMKERGITQALAHDIHYEQAGFEALLRRSP
jgi:predicted nucleic acid-binding protein